MAEDGVTFEISDHICVITINRPKARNALDLEAYAQLGRALDAAYDDADVRCVVITGAPEGRAFCSGDDVRKVMAKMGDAPSAEASRKSKNRATNARVRPQAPPHSLKLLEFDRPIIAAVNGVAVGWGMDLACLCDIIVASSEARFGSLFVKRGLVPDLGGLYKLPRLVGPQVASELLFTGRVVDAAEAQRIGLVSRVVAPDELMPTAMGLAREIAANPPLSLRYIKAGLAHPSRDDPRDLGAWISQTLNFLFTTEDHKESVKGFLEKRDVTFTGKLPSAKL